MGTETTLREFIEMFEDWNMVKLNNPQMGTETV